ncbi:hypothetical protein CI1B_31050 [Bradyrhizobium ivorense]|uniref:Uncharacterized protein n=1 Tax=Bradyrhizobium ivorense TaxID=2511166 RepID=A0A508T8B8_9BRAD|nr:hypothetical protein [Bradyrhizobium ivorense]VIO70451.1 hypothetical protein CI1B_31050 [Bradyrhizobium ivorense]
MAVITGRRHAEAEFEAAIETKRVSLQAVQGEPNPKRCQKDRKPEGKLGAITGYELADFANNMPMST